jgi:hypothetical protein
MSENLDLLGDPIPEGWGRRGRPQHIATEQNRNKVAILLAFGWNNERIAKALSITPPTLRKNYFRELRYRDEMRDRVEASMATTLWNLAKSGNVAAAKEFRKVMERNDLMLYGQAKPPEVKPVKPARLGKKEQSLADAHSPNTDSSLGALMARRQGANTH